MTARYTDAEWETFVAQIERVLVVPQEPYPCPEIGSPAFMRTIDHTLLKLDAKAVQVDDLCAEARVDGFAVCGLLDCSLVVGYGSPSNLLHRQSAFDQVSFNNPQQISKAQMSK